MFAYFVTQGVPPDMAAMSAGFADPKSAGRKLMRHPAIQAELMQHATAMDSELEAQSRFVLRTLLDATFTPATVKARISLELLKRADKKNELTPKRGLADLTEAELMRLITEAQTRLGVKHPEVI